MYSICSEFKVLTSVRDPKLIIMDPELDPRMKYREFQTRVRIQSRIRIQILPKASQIDNQDTDP